MCTPRRTGLPPPTRRGSGFTRCSCSATRPTRRLAGTLREGRAGANDSADHVRLLNQAMDQLPVKPKAEDPQGGVDFLVRADSAGATHAFIDAIVARGMEFSIGFDITEAVRLAILEVPKRAWTDAMRQDLEPLERAGVAEITPWLDLSTWPEGTRAI